VVSEYSPELVPPDETPHCEARAGLATAHGSAPTPEPVTEPEELP